MAREREITPFLNQIETDNLDPKDVFNLDSQDLLNILDDIILEQSIPSENPTKSTTIDHTLTRILKSTKGKFYSEMFWTAQNSRLECLFQLFGAPIFVLGDENDERHFSTDKVTI